jgi:hypothetical protein
MRHLPLADNNQYADFMQFLSDAPHKPDLHTALGGRGSYRRGKQHHATRTNSHHTSPHKYQIPTNSTNIATNIYPPLSHIPPLPNRNKTGRGRAAHCNKHGLHKHKDKHKNKNKNGTSKEYMLFKRGIIQIIILGPSAL